MDWLSWVVQSSDSKVVCLSALSTSLAPCFFSLLPSTFPATPAATVPGKERPTLDYVLKQYLHISSTDDVLRVTFSSADDSSFAQVMTRRLLSDGGFLDYARVHGYNALFALLRFPLFYRRNDIFIQLSGPSSTMLKLPRSLNRSNKQGINNSSIRRTPAEVSTALRESLSTVQEIAEYIKKDFYRRTRFFLSSNIAEQFYSFPRFKLPSRQFIHRFDCPPSVLITFMHLFFADARHSANRDTSSFYDKFQSIYSVYKVPATDVVRRPYTYTKGGKMLEANFNQARHIQRILSRFQSQLYALLKAHKFCEKRRRSQTIEQMRLADYYETLEAALPIKKPLVVPFSTVCCTLSVFLKKAGLAKVFGTGNFRRFVGNVSSLFLTLPHGSCCTLSELTAGLSGAKLFVMCRRADEGAAAGFAHGSSATLGRSSELVINNICNFLLNYLVIFTVDFFIKPFLVAVFKMIDGKATPLQANSQITETGRTQLVFFYRPLWKPFETKAFSEQYQSLIIRSRFSPIASSVPGDRSPNQLAVPLPPGKLCLVTKGDRSFRPIINMSYRAPQSSFGSMGLFKSDVSCNTLLLPVYHALLYELSLPSKDYVSARMSRNVNSTALEMWGFLSRQRPKHVVSTDVRAAFDSIDISVLLSLLGYSVSNNDTVYNGGTRPVFTDAMYKADYASGFFSAEEYIVRTYKIVELESGSPKVRTVTICDSLSSSSGFCNAMAPVHDGVWNAQSADTQLPDVPIHPKLLAPTKRLVVPHTFYRVTRRKVINLLITHLLYPVAIHRAALLRLTSGIAQGSVISTLLCNIYYALLEYHMLKPFSYPYRNLFLARFVDDWILLASRRDDVLRFREYLAKLQDINTTAVTICSTSNSGVTDAGTGDRANWCGRVVDLEARVVTVDYTRWLTTKMQCRSSGNRVRCTQRICNMTRSRLKSMSVICKQTRENLRGHVGNPCALANICATTAFHLFFSCVRMSATARRAENQRRLRKNMLQILRTLSDLFRSLDDLGPSVATQFVAMVVRNINKPSISRVVKSIFSADHKSASKQL